MTTESYGAFRRRFGFLPRMTAMLASAVLLLTMTICTNQAQAAPLVGTSIGNQASATYTDASAVTRTATSNTVQTIVQQVAGLTLNSTQTKTVPPGGTVYFPHTLTNTGNGTDSFTLGATPNSGVFSFTSVAIYPDANGDGVPDSFSPISSTGSLAAGASFKYIVAATVPPAATDSQSNTVTVNAVSAFSGASSASNTDTASVSGNAVISITKSVSPGSGDAGTGPLTYTLTYTNTGNATATNLRITDVIPAGLTYNTGNKARWSVTTTTALTDAADGTQGTAPTTINYDAVTTPGTVSAIISQVAPNDSRTLTFEVTVNAGATPGAINNTATFVYNDGANPNVSGATNTTAFTVNQTGGVVANGSNSSAVDGTGEPLTVASAAQGNTVSFPVYIWNTGNGSDSFDITVPSQNFPAGTTFVLYKADGVTPLVDTNGNGTPDTGPLAAGASYNVVVKAILPASATSASPVSATVIATSKQDNTKTNPVIVTLNSITANTVDLTLATARTDSSPAGTAAAGNAASTGFGAGPEAAALTPHKTANPNSTSTFVIKVNNTSPSADTYDFAASSDRTFAATTLPSGWSVIFKADASVAKDCSTVGSNITNTGVINLGTNATVCAVVTVPANAAAGTQEISFRALSPSSGANDTLRCAIDVNTIRGLSVTNNQTGQVFPGGTVVYQMTATNVGNVTEGTVATSGTPDGSTNSKVVLGIADSLTAQGWNAVVYFDANGNGVIDPTDPVVTDLSFISNGAAGLAPGESVPLLVKVFAPAGAAIGTTDVATLTATTSGVINVTAAPSGTPAPAPSTATATSTVISGQVTLVKTQALDAACDGTADAAFGQGNITTGAIPGACIIYRITATNVGASPVSTLVVSDATPANTVYNAGSQCPATGGTFVATTSVGSISAPTQCTAGTISATVGTLNPAASAVITFGVQINR